MTNIKEKITSKKGKMLLFATIIVAMMVPLNAGGIVNISADEKIADDSTDREKIMKKIEGYVIAAVQKTTKSDIDRINKQIQSDHRIKDLTKNKELSFVDYSYSGNLDELEQNPNMPLDIIMHYRLNDKPLTVAIDGQTEDISSIDVSTISGKLLPNHGMAIDFVAVGGPDINGLRMDMAAPDFVGEEATNWTGLLLNAFMEGSSGDVCNSINFPDAYWAQTGLTFDPNGDIDIVWADTTTDCDITPFVSAIDPNDQLTFWIQTETQIDEWAIYAYNYDTSIFYSQPVDGPDSSANIFTGYRYTSIFFENPTSTPNNGWSAGFNADPVVDAAYSRLTSNGSWGSWYGEELDDNVCNPGNLDPEDYMSGDLENGLIFDVSDIDVDCATGS